MAANVYESMFILDSNRFAQDPQGVGEVAPSIVQKCGGEILASRMWNEQKLAYPIRGHRKGTYWLTYFRMDSQGLATFNRECQLNDNILRNLTLRVDPRLADTLVSHALGEDRSSEEEEGSEESKEAPAPAAAAEGGKSASSDEKSSEN